MFFGLLVLFDVFAHLAEEDKARAKALERIGLVCFAVAVFSEAFAYPYSRRNDTLASTQDAEQRAKIAALDNSTQGLKAEAENARKQAEGFKAQIADSNARAKAAEAQVASLQERNLATEARLETERNTRLQLEHLNAARVIPLVHAGGKDSTDPLKPFAGMGAVIWYFPDGEAYQAAGYVAGAITNAGWNVVEMKPVENSLPEAGTRVEGLFDEQKSRGAAIALATFLCSFDWRTTNGIAPPTSRPIPPNTVLVRIGIRPYFSFVLPPGLQDFASFFESEEERARKLQDDPRSAEALKEMAKSSCGSLPAIPVQR